MTPRYSRGHAGTYVTPRYSRGHAGAYVTPRYSRGHAGAYVTPRYSRGHAGAYVTPRYSRGHAGLVTTLPYSRGSDAQTVRSRWLERSERLREYTRHYQYYGRTSRYYYCHGRWLPLPPGHIHGPRCGHIFRYGRWFGLEAVPYPIFVPVPVYANYYYDGGWYAEPPVIVEEQEVVVAPRTVPVAEYPAMRTKAERELELITRTYQLDWWQAKRIEDLISKQIIESILAGGEAGESSRIVFEKVKQRVTITGTPEDVMRIRTIVDDDRSYKLFTEEDLGGLVVDAVALVDLRFMEKDASAALRVAADNYSGADEVLRSSETSPAGREWWFNDRIGTMTVKDSPANLDALYDFMETRPYLR